MLSSGTSSRKRIALIAVFMAAFLAVLAATTFTLYRRARTHLDNELGERLTSVATLTAHLVEVLAPDSVSLSLPDHQLLNYLVVTREENALRNIVILTPSGNTVVDLAGLFEPGAPNPFIDLDYSAFTLARSGIPAPTRLYRIGDDYLKSAYAPVTSSGHVFAVVGIDADAAFFAELRDLTTLIFVITAMAVAVVIVLGALFVAQTRSLDRAEALVVRRENLATMGRMVANIAHEIRNPLSVIRTSAQRLRRRHPEDDEVYSFISDEVDELNRILTGYLQFAQTGSVEFAPTSVRRIVSRCMVAVQDDATRGGVALADELPAGDISIHGDENRLRQALLNVLLNAIQATGQGGRVVVSAAQAGGTATIQVSDTGHGIDEKDLREVTKPFYTRRAGGSGLGLNIVQSIVDEHDGRLDIESSVGEGTRVTMTFPAGRNPATD